MDRSFLSHDAVIEASRQFVCVRCATYEDAEEAKFLKWIFARDDNLENTVFCMLSPDGRDKLIRGQRGPHNYRDASDMADHLKQIAREYGSDSKGFFAVPRMKNVRLGLNVAACDCLPAIVVLGDTDEQVKELAARLSPAAWHEALAGAFIYCSTTDPQEVEVIKGLNGNAGYAIVEPDAFGQTARVLAQLDADVSQERLQEAMTAALQAFERPVKDHHRHVRSGHRSKIAWETEIPVEDPMALRAQQGGGSQKRGGARGRRSGKRDR